MNQIRNILPTELPVIQNMHNEYLNQTAKLGGFYAS